jgi:hypothetical protein
MKGGENVFPGADFDPDSDSDFNKKTEERKPTSCGCGPRKARPQSMTVAR